MADLYTQAKQEADATAAAKIAAYEAERKAATDTYTLARQQWDSGRKAALGTMQGQQEDDRARNANRMAARGIGVGEGALVNYGRLNAQHEGQLAGVERDYGDNLGKISLAYQNGVGEVEGKIAAARATAEAEAMSIYRQLQAAAASSAGRSGGGGGGGGGSSSASAGALDDPIAYVASARDSGVPWANVKAELQGYGYSPLDFQTVYYGANQVPWTGTAHAAARPQSIFAQYGGVAAAPKPATTYAPRTTTTAGFGVNPAPSTYSRSYRR